MKNHADIVIIGGGPGGYVAALRAAQLKLKVILIEQTHLGGICLNWGCIPTKALLKSGELLTKAHTLHNYGITASAITADIGAMVKRSREVSAQLSSGISFLLKKAGVQIIMGKAQIRKAQKPFEIAIDSSKTVTADHVVIASGARARPLPIAYPEGTWTFREAMIPTEIPSDLLVIGAGAIGIEFASFYAMLGARVTVVERNQTILPLEDFEVSALAHTIFEKKGIAFALGHTVTALSGRLGSFCATLTNAEGQSSAWTGSHVLTCIGVIGNVENLGLEHTSVIIENGQIQIAEDQQTAHPGIFAIGDVAGPPWLAHKASHEGVICANAIAGHSFHPLKRPNIPGCIYSSPQIASIGLSEQSCSGRDIKIGKFPIEANGQARASGEKEGFVKTIFDRTTGELLGAHMIGAGVSELIHGFAIAKTLEATEEDLQQVIFPHPSLSEIMHEAVLDASDVALHI